MKKKSSIIKLSLIGVAIIVGFVLAFCPIKIGLKDYNGFASKIKQGLDLQGGINAVYEVSSTDRNIDFSMAMDSTVASFKRILTSKNYDATLSREGGNKFRVSVPGLDDPQEIGKVMANPPTVIFRVSGADTEILTAKHVAKATSMLDPSGDGTTYAVTFSLTSEGAALFETATAENSGSSIEIVLVAEDFEEVLSTSSISSTISGGQVSIGGMSSLDSATQLAQQMTAGKYDLSITQREVAIVPDTLGETALLAGVIAGILALVVIFALMGYFYGLFGAASAISTLIHTVVYLFILAVFPWTELTLAGIAGLLLAIGLTLVSNIIICERIKDEYKGGKSILSATHYGYRKSLATVADIHVLPFVAGILLLILGTGSMQGFASVLMIGTVLSALCSLVFTKGIMNYFVRINQSEPKLYRLTRGEGFENLGADQNDAKTEEELMRAAQRKAERKKSEQTSERGDI